MKDWENDYDFDDKKSNVIVRKTSGVLGKLIALLLGMVIGAGGVVGGTLGLGYYVATRPIESLVDKTNGLVGDKINLQEYLDKYLNAPYQEQSAVGLALSVKYAIGKISNGEAGFSALNEISPAVGEAIETLAKKMVEFGSNLTVEQIKADLLDTPFKQLGAYISGTLINSIEIGNLLLSTGAFEFDTLTQDSLMMLLFYGVEEEDYVLDYKKNAQGEYLDKDGNVTTNPNAYVKEILMQGTSLPLSVGTIRNEGITDLLANIPLDSLIQVDPDEALMASLAYGSKEYYEVIYKKDATGNYLDKNGNITTDPAQYVKTVQMKQAVYTLVDKGIGAEFYDKNDVMLKKSPIKGGYMVTLADGKTKQYLKQSGDTYLAYKRYDAQTGDYYGKAPYSKTTVGDLQQHAGGLLNKIELASAFGVDETSNPILITLAYGLEGEDFYYDTDGKIQMHAGKSKKSIGDLQNGLDDTITNLPLKTIMNVDPENAMIVSLAYGSANRYEFVYGTDENGDPVKVDVTMNPVVYTFKGGIYYDDKNNEYVATTENGVTYITIDGEKQYLKLVSGSENKYNVFRNVTDTEPIKYSPITVGSLQENPSDLLNSIEIASVMSIDETSNPILITLAYGLEGEDFYYDINGKIQMYEGKTKKTIGSLQGDEVEETISIMPLDTLMDIDFENGMMLSLAYGSSNRYEFVYGTDENGDPVKVDVTMTPVEYTFKDDKFYDDKNNEYTPVQTNVIEVGETTQYLKLVTGTTDLYYAYESADAIDPIKYKPSTVKQLQENPAELMDTIELASVLEVDGSSNRILLALAYESYKVENGVLVETTGPRTIKDLNTRGDELIDGITLADALGIDANSHPVMIALAYEKNTEVQEDEHGNKSFVNPPENPRSISDLSGDKSTELFNSIELGSALSLNAKDYNDPDKKLLFSLAYGQYNVHYTIEEQNGSHKLQMQPKFYTHDQETNVLYDEYGKEVPFQSLTETSINSLTLVLPDGKEQKLYSLDGVKYEVYENDEKVYFKAATLGSLSNDSSSLLDNVTLVDALNITANSHPVLIALAYEDEYEIESNPDGSKYFVKEPKKQRTIQALSGENSNELLDGITLEAALSVNANSQPLMLGLAYGQKHLHYEVEDGKIVMQNKFYQYDSISGIWTDASDNELTSVPTPLPGSSGVYELTLNGKAEYLKEGANGNYYSYSDKACTDANTFEKATLGDLGGENSGLLNNLTLADALGIESFETEPNALKKALAFNKDGSHAYTIGEFSKDPNVIINNIHLDSVIENVQTTDKTTMYLLYGKEDLHFKVSDTPSTDTDPEIFKPDDLTTYYVVMLQKQMTVHQLSMGEAYHVHNEYGELLKDENGFNIVANPIEYNGNACYLYTYEGVTYLLEPDTTLPEIRIKSADHHNVTNTAYYLYRVKTYDETTDEIELEPLDKNLDFYQHNTISNLTGNDSIISHLTERLTLEELVGAHTLAGNKILEPLSHVTIEELPSAVNTLTVSEIFGDQFEYKKAEEDIYDADGTTLLVRQGAYYNMLGESGKAQTIYYNLEDCTFYTTPDFQAETKTEGILTGTWKYLLKDSNGDITNPALVTGMEGMIENITLNMQTTSLNELNDDDIISTSASLRQEPILDTIVDADVNATILSGKDATQAQLYGYKGKTLGDLTITQMTRYLELLLNAYNNLVP